MPTAVLRDQDIAFLARRQRALKAWPVMAGLLLIGLVGLAIWMYFNSPLLIDPLAVGRAIETGDLERGSLTMLALLTPLLMLTLFVMTAILIFFGFVFFSNEGRYQAMIAALLTENP